MLVGVALSLGALGLTSILEVSIALAIAIAAFAFMFGGTAQLVLQTVAPPRIRGRVLALYAFFFYSLLPASTIVVGVLADIVGAQAVLLSMGALTVLATALVGLANPGLLAIDVRDGRLVVRGREAAESRP